MSLGCIWCHSIFRALWWIKMSLLLAWSWSREILRRKGEKRYWEYLNPKIHMENKKLFYAQYKKALLWIEIFLHQFFTWKIFWIVFINCFVFIFILPFVKAWLQADTLLFILGFVLSTYHAGIGWSNFWCWSFPLRIVQH